MTDEKIERRINLKFPMKLGKSATGSFRLLTDVYGDDYMSRDFERHKRFREGLEEVDDFEGHADRIFRYERRDDD